MRGKVSCTWAREKGKNFAEASCRIRAQKNVQWLEQSHEKFEGYRVWKLQLRWVNNGCLCDLGISGAHRMLGKVSNRFCFKTAIGGQSFTELSSGLQVTAKSRIM